MATTTTPLPTPFPPLDNDGCSGQHSAGRWHCAHGRCFTCSRTSTGRLGETRCCSW